MTIAMFFGRHVPGGFLDDAAVGLADELRGLQIGAEPRDGLIDGIEELVTDLGLAVGHAVGVSVDEGLGRLGVVGPALLLPLPFLSLDDEAVARDPVFASRFLRLMSMVMYSRSSSQQGLTMFTAYSAHLGLHTAE